MLAAIIVSYYVYTRVVGLTWTNIKEGHFMFPPIEPPPPTLCKWGEWLPCENGKQMRYETFASDEETAFECGKVRQVEDRECTQLVCTREYMPVCACTEYDMDNVCQTHKTFANLCALGVDTSSFVAGMCEKKNMS